MTNLQGVEAETVFFEWNHKIPGQKRDISRAALVADLLQLRNSKTPPIIGVVGSKGKGTTAAYASAHLYAAGLKVGTIMSPGLATHQDRIRVNGLTINDNDYVESLEVVRRAAQSLPVTPSPDGYLSPSGFFMLAGLTHFLKQNCDVIVVEAGMGGASDELSLFALHGVAMTQVFPEHSEVLGSSISKIAANKIFVASPTTRFVNYLPQTTEAETAIQARAAVISVPANRINVNLLVSTLDGLPPGLNAQNAVLGIETANSFLATHTDGFTAAFRSEARPTVCFPGRLSRHTRQPQDVIVDSAVNRDGLRTALDFASDAFGRPPQLILVSIPADKDYAGFITELGNHESRTVFVQMVNSHLTFPDRGTWPREWATSGMIPHLLGEAEKILAVGTATFTAAILQALHVDTRKIF